MRSRLIARLLAIAALLLAPAGGGAGTAADPEIVDPAGDVSWIPDGDLSFMDLRAAWFESMRDDNGVLDGFTITIRTAAPRPADKPLALMASWQVGGGCRSEVHVADDATSLGVVQWTAQAWVYSWCEGDENVITLGPLTVVVLQDGREVSFARDGVDYVVTIPLAIFDGTRADGWYAEGATLEQATVNTFKVLPFVWIGVDYNEGARAFTLGS